MCCMYTNQEAIHYQSIFITYVSCINCQGAVYRDVPVYIDTSNKIATIDLVRSVYVVTYEVQWAGSL